MLELPTELLQHIASLVGAYTLPNVRLVCRTLAAASFDSFASEFLTNIVCFFPDPARVRRLQNILSSRALAQGVKNIDFTLDPLECREQYLNHIYSFSESNSRSFKTWFPYPPDFQELTEVLAHLKADGCDFSISVDADKSILDRIHITRHLHMLLAAILEAGYPVHTLSILASHVNPHFLSQRTTDDLNIARGLRRFSYHIPVSATVCGIARMEQSVQDTCSLLRTTIHLESLEIGFLYQTKSDSSSLVHAGNRLFDACNSTSLRELKLSTIRLDDFDSLFDILRRNRGTLEVVSLVDVVVVSGRNLWTDFLKILCSIQKLQALVLDRVYLQNSSGCSGPLRMYESRGRYEVQHPSRYEVTGSSFVAASLSRILQHRIDSDC